MSFRFRPQLAYILLAALTFAGCSSLVLKPEDNAAETTGKIIMRGLLFLPSFGASERRISRHRDSVPITDGYQTRPSPSTATLVVVGSNNTANNAAITWLQKRGVSIVERTNIDRILLEQQIRLTHSSDEEGMLLRVGRLLGASEMIFVEASQSSVSVRSVELDSGRIGWTGSAHYRSNKTIEAGGGLTKLTCQALATAWGFRPPGDHFIPSQDMCDLRVPKPVSE